MQLLVIYNSKKSLIISKLEITSLYSCIAYNSTTRTRHENKKYALLYNSTNNFLKNFFHYYKN